MKFLVKYYAPNPPNNDYMGPSKDDIKNSQLLNDSFSDMRNNLRGVSVELKTGLEDGMRNLNVLTRQVVKSIEKGIAGEIKGAEKLTENLNNATKNVGKTLNSEAKVREKIKDNEAKKERIIDLINEAQREGVTLTTQIKKAADDLLITLHAQDAALDSQLKKVIRQEESTKKYHERLEKTFTAISKIPLLGSLINVSKIMEKVKDTAEEGGGKIKQLLAGFGEMGKQLSDPFALAAVAIGGLFSLFKSLFKMALEFDQKIYDAAKNLGVSVKEAERLHGQFQAIAASGMNLGLQAKDLVKTYSELNEQLGFMVPSSAAFAGNMTLIQKRIGASAADMEALATASAYSGNSIKSTYGTLVGTAKVEAARNGFMMTNRQILDAIAKTSKTVLMNFGGNVKELVKAIVQAKKLGTTLEEIQSRGNSMLDFESSISKEFEFQALSGKTLDLSRARQLAQTRDTVGLMKELNKQGLNFTEWQKLGNIEQQSYAEMMGTSVDKLNEQYNQQKLITALGAQEGESLAARYKILMKTVEGREKIAASLSKEEQADLARASANEEWEATLQRIKDLLGSMLRGPVVEIVHTVTGWLNNTKLVHEFGMKVKGVFQGIAEFVKNIPGYIEKIPNILNKIITLAKAWFSISVGIAVANAAASMGAVPLVGVGLGLAAAGVMYAALSSMVPDFKTSNQGPSGAPAGSTEIKPMNKAAEAAKQGNELAKSQRAATDNTGVIQNNMIVKIGETSIAAVTSKGQVNSYQNSTDVGRAKISQTAAMPHS